MKVPDVCSGIWNLFCKESILFIRIILVYYIGVDKRKVIYYSYFKGVICVNECQVYGVNAYENHQI